MEGFSCTMYHNVTYNSICIYICWVCCFLQCVVQSPSKSSTTIKTFFFRSIWLIIVLILFSLGMCGTHFTMSVKVLHTYGKEAIGDDVCHMALRWKFCPKIVSSVSCAVFVVFLVFFSTAAVTFVLTKNKPRRPCWRLPFAKRLFDMLYYV